MWTFLFSEQSITGKAPTILTLLQLPEYPNICYKFSSPLFVIKYLDKIKSNIILPINPFFLIDDSYWGEKTSSIRYQNSNFKTLTCWLVNTFSVFLCPGVIKLFFSNLQYEPL